MSSGEPMLFTGDEEREAARRVLLVGGDPDQRAAIVRRLQGRSCRCTHVARLDDAQTAIARRRYDLVAVHRDLPDGSGLDLLGLVAELTPGARSIVCDPEASLEAAVEAVRRGAIDVVTRPHDVDELVGRIESAFDRIDADAGRDRKVRRLQRLCVELDAARREISRKVETLCREMNEAYEGMSEQLDDVAMASEFRTLIRQELDVEELLRTALEYLLTRTGPTNAAVFLPDADRHYSLGAYVNYDCPRASIDTVLEHLARSICPQMEHEEDLVAFTDAAEFAEFVGIEDGIFAGSEVVAFSCRHEGDCLAVVILFRQQDDPFTDALAGTLDTLRRIFAEQLSRLVHVHHRARPQWPDEAWREEDELEDDEFGWGGGLAA